MKYKRIAFKRQLSIEKQRSDVQSVLEAKPEFEEVMDGNWYVTVGQKCERKKQLAYRL